MEGPVDCYVVIRVISLLFLGMTPEAKMSQPNLKQLLKDFVGSKVTLSDSNCKDSVAVVQHVVEKFVGCMRQDDPLFNELYQNIYYTGSYYEGLKVNEANEFDLNIRLKMPFKKEHYEIVHHGVPHGFVQYKLCRPLEMLLSREPKWNVFMNLDKIMDDSHTYLSQDKLNHWLQSVVDTTLMKHAADFPNIKRSCNGPAKTLKITSLDNGPILDVDLVPVVQLVTYPGSVDKIPELQNIDDNKKTCFIVPKPPAAPTANSDLYFRVSIPDAEKLMMHQKGCVKMLIKIFKAIRDLEKWKFLSSYYIKTVFLFQLKENPDPAFWSEKNLDTLFLQMLKEFIAVMTNEFLPHIFFSKYNLLSAAPRDTMKNCKGRLENILKWSTKDLASLKAYLMKARKVTAVSARNFHSFVNYPIPCQTSWSQIRAIKLDSKVGCIYFSLTLDWPVPGPIY